MSDEPLCLKSENARLRAALSAYCRRCPNCRGNGRQLRIGLHGQREEVACGSCVWAWDALGADA